MTLRNLDLNLLTILATLLSEKNVTKSASILGMSQPSVSRALQRLREQFNDPLLIRDANDYQLSQLAQEIEPKLKELLQDLELLYNRSNFDPQNSDYVLRLGMLEDCADLFLPAITRMLAEKAPKIRINVVNQWGKEFDQLKTGAVDFLLDIFPSIGIGLHVEPIIPVEWVCVMDANHPQGKAPLDVESYAGLKHILVTATGDGVGLVDGLLRQQGLNRETVLRLPFFQTALDCLPGSDLVVTLPRLVAEHARHHHNLIVQPAPVTFPDFNYSLIWHQRNISSSLHQWLIKEIVQTCSALQSSQ